MSILWNEAKEIWIGTDARPVGTIVSIGTGHLDPGCVVKKVHEILKTVVNLATDTERVTQSFWERVEEILTLDRPKYFRFNVERGLERIALDEWKQYKTLMEATNACLADPRVKSEVRACAEALVPSESM